MFLLQNLRLLNGKDITKLANHVRRVNSRKLTSKVRWAVFSSLVNACKVTKYRATVWDVL